MQKISSEKFRRLNKILPFSCWVVPVIFPVLIYLKLGDSALRELVWQIVFPALIVFSALMHFFLWKSLSVYCDEVWEDGSVIIVKHRGIEERIPVSNLKSLYAQAYHQPGASTGSQMGTVTLILKTPGRLGDKIRFKASAEFDEAKVRIQEKMNRRAAF